MSKSVNTFVAEPFKNNFGQTINPGDKVAYVTNSRHMVDMRKGWFDGVFKNNKGEIVFTRIRGIKNTKYVKTGKIIEYKYIRWEDKTPAVGHYPETKLVDCEPEGTTVLQCHRIIKIEE